MNTEGRNIMWCLKCLSLCCLTCVCPPSYLLNKMLNRRTKTASSSGIGWRAVCTWTSRVKDIWGVCCRSWKPLTLWRRGWWQESKLHLDPFWCWWTRCPETDRYCGRAHSRRLATQDTFTDWRAEVVTYRQNMMLPSSRSIRQLTMSPAAHDWQHTQKHSLQPDHRILFWKPRWVWVSVHLSIVSGGDVPLPHSVSIISVRVRSVSDSLLRRRHTVRKIRAIVNSQNQVVRARLYTDQRVFVCVFTSWLKRQFSVHHPICIRPWEEISTSYAHFPAHTHKQKMLFSN